MTMEKCSFLWMDRATFQDLLRNVPEKFRQDAHHWLILHGRYVCTARKPKCAECIVADLCREGRKLIRSRKI